MWWQQSKQMRLQLLLQHLLRQKHQITHVLHAHSPRFSACSYIRAGWNRESHIVHRPKHHSRCFPQLPLSLVWHDGHHRSNQLVKTRVQEPHDAAVRSVGLVTITSCYGVSGWGPALARPKVTATSHSSPVWITVYRDRKAVRYTTSSAACLPLLRVCVSLVALATPGLCFPRRPSF